MSLLFACSSADETVTIDADPALVESGILDVLITEFEATHGGVELTLTDDQAEISIVAGGDGHVVLETRYLLIGPSRMLDHASGLEVPEVLRRTAEEGLPFVGPGPGSGTYEAEQEAWLESGFNPTGEPWYTTPERSLVSTVGAAGVSAAITLCEWGVCEDAGYGGSLVDLEVDPEGLESPYSALLATTAGADAMAFVEWLLSDDGVAAIATANQELFGEVIYEPGVLG